MYLCLFIPRLTLINLLTGANYGPRRTRYANGLKMFSAHVVVSTDKKRRLAPHIDPFASGIPK